MTHPIRKFAAARRSDDAESLLDTPNFVPVPRRERADGWSPERQVAFIEALAQAGCVREAAESVGMSVRSAYRLRQHIGAETFRLAWDAALGFALGRLEDAALSRAINGVARPIMHKGEVVGERRYYDERLTQFILRTRDPERFGRWIDRNEFEQKPDGQAKSLTWLTLALARGDGPESDQAAGALPVTIPPGDAEESDVAGL